MKHETNFSTIDLLINNRVMVLRMWSGFFFIKRYHFYVSKTGFFFKRISPEGFMYKLLSRLNLINIILNKLLTLYSTVVSSQVMYIHTHNLHLLGCIIHCTCGSYIHRSIGYWHTKPVQMVFSSSVFLLGVTHCTVLMIWWLVNL